MLVEINTGLNEIHERSLNRPLDDDIVNILRFRHSPHLLQVVRVLVDVPKLVNDNVETAIELKDADDDPDTVLGRVGVAHAADQPVGGYRKG
ncbi:ABC transporter [Halogeometricum borinquense DSM 11551]|uniref:ABC transporter n=1 Tax=Halogeometricum borinquense (strain ATCC 700274 / DSM 11551 / JCM 10706 / KCTC 4070 / PR3) TaxID=469382 RepID=L9UZ14_HALBP|nr:ABC transporter [Halogeometricum borinquense DSM 11551]